MVVLTKAQMHKERMYQSTMLMAKNLLEQGIISDEEYGEIDTMFREKYAVSLSTLFTDIHLIKFDKYGNMSH